MDEPQVYEILSDYNNCDRVYHNIRKSIIEEVKSLDGGAQQLTVTQVRRGLIFGTTKW